MKENFVSYLVPTLVDQPAELAERRAQRVKEVLAGKDYREEAARLGLHYTTLYDMARGVRKSHETVVKFAQGFGLPLVEWLTLYGYTTQEKSPNEMIREALLNTPSLSYDPDFEDFDIRRWDGADRLHALTEEDLDEINKAMRSVMSEKRRRQGRE